MFGESIKRARLSKNMSQTELSSETGIPQTSISDLEREKYIPKVNVYLELAKVLDLDTDVLFKTLDEGC